ncbi:MAG: hypothetical protein IKE03_06425 [Blautia sp.]|nr:hypothetical protein [Blautia sp.]
MRAGKACAAVLSLLVTAAACCCPASAREQGFRNNRENNLIPLDEEEWGVPQDEQGFTFDGEEEENTIASFTVNPDQLDFGTVFAGYTQQRRPAFEVEVTNTGDTLLNLMEPVSANGWFESSVPETLSLAPGEETVFTLVPVVGLEPDVYDDEITFACTDHACDPQTVYVDLTVTEPEMDLTGIEIPVMDDALPNGTVKNAQDLGLPDTLTIHTTQEDLEAAVHWKLEDCAYNPESIDEQTFDVVGEVILPDGVGNPDGIDTLVEVQLFVAARIPYHADPSLSRITGIDAGGEYTTQTRLTFTALGDGCDNERPMEGDTRFMPTGWKVLESRTFEKGTQTASFRIAKAGGFTLSVIFKEEKYDGSEWHASGLQDTKQVNFHIKNAPDSEALPPAKTKDASVAGTRMIKPVITEDASGSVKYYVGLMLLAATAFMTIMVLRKTDSVSTQNK